MSKDEIIPSDNDRVRNIAQGMGWLAIQNLATSFLGFLFLAALLRLLPPVQFGIYSAILVSTGVASSFASFGLNQAIVRFVSSIRQKNETLSWVAARRILYLALVFTVVVTVVYSAATPYLSIYFTKSESWAWVFFLSGLYLFLSSITNICQGIIQGLKKYALLARMLFISRMVMVIFGIGTLFFYRNISVAIIAWIIFSSIIAAWTFAITGRNLIGAKGTFQYSEVLKYSYPIGIAAIVAVFASSADLIVVGGYLNALSLGVYNAAIMISSILSAVLIGPLTTTFLPEISSTTSVAEISNGLRLALRFIVLIVLPASLFVAAVPNQLIVLFSGGGGYLIGNSSLELIAVFYLFLAIQTVFVVLFQAIGKTMYVLLIGLATVATDVSVSILLVPRLGLLGAASAKISVGLVGALLGFYLARNYLQKLDHASFYLKCLITAVIPLIPTLALSHYLSIRTITLVPYAIVYSAAFIACLKIFNLLSDEDKAFISHIVPRFMQRLVRMI